VQYDRAEGVISLARRHCRSATGRIAPAVSAIDRAATAIARAVTAIVSAFAQKQPGIVSLQPGICNAARASYANMVQRSELASYTQLLICLRNQNVFDASWPNTHSFLLPMTMGNISTQVIDGLTTTQRHGLSRHEKRFLSHCQCKCK
jgi:hypothetical protein